MAKTVTSHTPVAVTYARSLLDLANEQQQAEPIGEEIKGLREIIESNPGLAAHWTRSGGLRESRGRAGSSGVEASSLTKRSSSRLPARPGSRAGTTCASMSSSPGSSHQAPAASCTAHWPKRSKERKREAMDLRARARSRGPSNIITPTIIIKLVGWSMRSQAVSTPEMRSRGVLGMAW